MSTSRLRRARVAGAARALAACAALASPAAAQPVAAPPQAVPPATSRPPDPSTSPPGAPADPKPTRLEPDRFVPVAPAGPLPAHAGDNALRPAEGGAWKMRAGVVEGFGVDHDDGTFGVAVGLVSQMRFETKIDGDDVRPAFAMRMVRPTLRAHVLKPWIRVFVQPELAGTSSRLLDFEIDVQPAPEFGVKTGQLVTPFSRTFITPVPKLLFQNFSVANDYFRGDRDTGVMAYGYLLGARLEYYAGLFNGNGIDQGGNDDKSLTVFGRIAGTAFG